MEASRKDQQKKESSRSKIHNAKEQVTDQSRVITRQERAGWLQRCEKGRRMETIHEEGHSHTCTCTPH